MNAISRRVRSVASMPASFAITHVAVGFLPFWLAASGWSLAWQIARFALPLIALRTTSSPFRISLVSLALTLPWLLVALPAGAIADRLTRPAVVRGATVVFAVGSIVLVASILSDRLPFGLILLLTFVLGAANVQNVIAFSAATADVVPEEALEEANARLTASDTLAEIIGPAIGGVLILAGIVFAPGSALLLALGVIALLGPLRVRPHAHAVVEERTSPWSGLGIVRRDRLLLTITAMACAINLTIGDFGGPGWAVLTLTLQAERVAIRQRGRVMAAYRFLTFGAMAIGAVAGGAGASVWGVRPVFALCAGLTLVCVVPWWLVVRTAWGGPGRPGHPPSRSPV